MKRDLMHSVSSRSRASRHAWGSLSGISLLALLAGVLSASAQTSTWNGAGSDGNWSTGANWGGTAPTGSVTTNIEFAGSTGLASTVDAPFTLLNLQFDTGAGAFTLSGSTLSIHGTANYGADVVNKSTATETINNNWALLSATGFKANLGALVLDGNIATGGFGLGFLATGGETLTMNGVVSGAGSLTINGGSATNADVVLNGINTYTGITSIFGGTVLLKQNALSGQAGALGNATTDVTLGNISGTYNPGLETAAAVTVGRNIRLTSNPASGLVYTVGGSTADISSFTGNITLNTSGGGAAMPLTLTAAAGGRVNFSGNVLRDAAATGTGDNVTVSGGGTIALSGANNDYQGTTTVAAGKLLVNGTLASGGGTVTVNSGAMLGGTGTISRAVTIASGGILAAGDGGAGTLMTGSLTLNNTSVLDFELGSIGGTNDMVAVGGNLVLDGVLNVTDIGGLAAGDYRLFTYTGSLTDNAVTLAGVPAGFSYTIDTATAGTVFLDVTAVPEPSALALIAVGGMAFLGRRRLLVRLVG